MNDPLYQRRKIIESFELYNVPEILQNVILEALNSSEWDWFHDCDGCTMVADYWPSKFHPACLVHDFYWVTGRGGKEADLIFKEIMKAYALPPSLYIRRYIGVRVGWFAFYKWKHLVKGNKKPLTPAMKAYLEYKRKTK